VPGVRREAALGRGHCGERALVSAPTPQAGHGRWLMGSIRRHAMSDAQWARLAPLLPPRTGHVGKPAHDHRPILNGILWKLRTGAPWRDLPARSGPWSTVACRFRRWRLAVGGDQNVWFTEACSNTIGL